MIPAGHSGDLVIAGTEPGLGGCFPNAASGTWRTYHRFSRCRSRSQLYRHGAHSKRLVQIIDPAVRATYTGASE